MDDRRRHPRFRVKWSGRILLADRSLHQVRIHDVSKGGVGIDFHQLLAVGTQVNIEFNVRYKGEIETLRAQTQVAFTTMLANNSGATLGLQFNKISREHMHILANVLHVLANAD